MGVGPLSLPRRPFKLLSIPLFTPPPPRPTHTPAPGAAGSAPAARTGAIGCVRAAHARLGPGAPAGPGAAPPTPEPSCRAPALSSSFTSAAHFLLHFTHTLSPSCLRRSFLPVLRVPSSSQLPASRTFFSRPGLSFSLSALFGGWRRDSVLGCAARCFLRNRDNNDCNTRLVAACMRRDWSRFFRQALNVESEELFRWLNPWAPSILVERYLITPN